MFSIVNNPAVVMTMIFMMLTAALRTRRPRDAPIRPSSFAEQHAARYNILNKRLTSVRQNLDAGHSQAGGRLMSDMGRRG
jgi:hypothetical protein